MKHILKCSKCKSYGLSEICACGHKRTDYKPPKYSPEDKYGKYRREAKRLEKEKKDN
ncbi:MAG TPA: nucleolar RNA-binding Nop10p family protein [Alphaproteobacteria bacterium]|nr:nucleolar RNA-binding Nop10p family protein [Alphaproteobacteria bacterium]